MKKVFGVFAAILFVCCVVSYGESKRFSAELMLNNLTNFGNAPSLELIMDTWTEDSYRPGSDMPEWIEWYEKVDEGQYLYRGTYPLAYTSGTDQTTLYDYQWVMVYNADGTWNRNPRAQAHEDGSYPVIVDYETEVFFEEYDGGTETLEFFDGIRAFFRRVVRTIQLLIDILLNVLGNVKYLLPWNNTVEVTT